jgi:hypothetical protein
MAAAYLVRDPSWGDGEWAVGLVELYRQGTKLGPAQKAFVEAWSWPRRNSVRRALAKHRRGVEQELDHQAEVDPEGAVLWRLVLEVRRHTRPDDLETLHLGSVTRERDSPIVFYVTGCRDPGALERLIRRRAAKHGDSSRIVVVPADPAGLAGAVQRVLPAPPERLGG